MKKTPPESIPLSVKIGQLKTQLKSCRQFLEATEITGITIIFATTTNNKKSVGLLKLEGDTSQRVNLEPLTTFVKGCEKDLGHLISALEGIQQAADSLSVFNDQLSKHFNPKK